MNFKILKSTTKPLKPNKLAAFELNSSDSEDDLVLFHRKNDPNSLIEMAYTLVDNNKFGPAIHKFNQVIEHPHTSLDLKCKCHDMVAQLLTQNGQVARAIQFCEAGIELIKDPDNNGDKDDMTESNQNLKSPLKALLYQTMARAQRNLGELSISLINFKKSKEYDEFNIELNEELDLEIQEIENMIEKQKPIFGDRYIMKGSNIDNIRADHAETMLKMKFPVEFTNDSPIIIKDKITPEELESVMSGRIGWEQAGKSFKGSCSTSKRKLPEIADVD